MSTQQSELETDVEQADNNSEQTHGPSRDERYEESTRSAYRTIGDASEAFTNYQIKPSRTKTSLKTRRLRFEQPAWYHYASSLHCYQFPNGVGLQERVGTRDRGVTQIRMQDGNRVRGTNAEQMLNWLEETEFSVTDIVTQHHAENSYGGFARRSNFVTELEMSDGVPNGYLVVLYDGSANRRSRSSASRAGLYVGPDDPKHAQVEQILKREAYGQLSDLVAPPEVLSSELPVVDSSTYRNKSGRSNAGGYGSEESIGSIIVRQGEWYFIPQNDMSVDEDDVMKPLSEREDSTVLGSHIPRDQYIGDESAQYVRGTVRHERNEHSMFNLYDTWHKVLENTEGMFAFESTGNVRVE